MSISSKPARFHYRLGANQPAASPTARRLGEMAEAIHRETGGAFRLDVYPESRLGPDPQMFADLHSGALEFYLSGALLGGVAPTSALPLLPFAFSDSNGGVRRARRRARRHDPRRTRGRRGSTPFGAAGRTASTISPRSTADPQRRAISPG